MATHPDAILTFKKSSIILAIHSDASYLAKRKPGSRAGWHLYFADGSKEEHPYNAPVHSIAQIIRNVMTSAFDAEIGALFVNSRQAISARQWLEKVGHLQPPTRIQSDNTTGLRFVTKNLQPKPTKSTEMNYWLCATSKTGNSLSNTRSQVNATLVTLHQTLLCSQPQGAANQLLDAPQSIGCFEGNIWEFPTCLFCQRKGVIET